MDYKELIENLNGYFEGKELKRGDALKAATAIETLLEERDAAWWTSVKERLPESGQLISYANCRATGNSYGILRVPKWETGKRYDFWMPLPEPPCYSEERVDTP